MHGLSSDCRLHTFCITSAATEITHNWLNSPSVLAVHTHTHTYVHTLGIHSHRKFVFGNPIWVAAIYLQFHVSLHALDSNTIATLTNDEFCPAHLLCLYISQEKLLSVPHNVTCKKSVQCSFEEYVTWMGWATLDIKNYIPSDTNPVTIQFILRNVHSHLTMQCFRLWSLLQMTFKPLWVKQVYFPRLSVLIRT